MAASHIVHSIPPTYDERSRVLVLGSVPSPLSRETGFNYGHPRNRFWQVLARLANEPVPSTNDRKRDFCLRHHIALWDVVAECDIEGASDASIRNARANDLARITNAAPIEAVFCTGAKAAALYDKLGCAQATGLEAIRLPSTSPANAAANLDTLCSAYAAIFEHTHEFEPPALAVADVVTLEQTIAAAGTPLAELMDRAGTAVAWRTKQILAEIEAGTYPQQPKSHNPLDTKPVVILCGNGNNGGDGWVAAELLASEGYLVCVVSAKTPDQLTAEPARAAAERAWKALLDLGGCVIERGNATSCDAEALAAAYPLVLIDPDQTVLQAVLADAAVVVDALLGTGFKHDDVREPMRSWIAAANAKRDTHAALAVDIASGIHADDGSAAATCMCASETLTMIVRKPGLNAAECGSVRVAPLAYIEPFLAL